ncbi:MAG: Gfo/Idh/MocA family protein [Longimicrobiales bacterium]
MKARLGIGFIGSGFNARFHVRAWQSVRDADVRGFWSPTNAHMESAAALARDLDVGEARTFRSITEMVADPVIDAIWLTGPNHRRVENVEEIVRAIESGQGSLTGLACEKPLARNVAEAEKVVELVQRVGLRTGYLENQVFSPDIERGRELLWRRGAATTGRPYLERAA